MELDLSTTGNLRLAISALSARNSSPNDIFFWLTKARNYVNDRNCTWHDLGTSEEALMSILRVAQRQEVIQEVSGLIAKSTTDREKLWVIYKAVVFHNISHHELPGISEEAFDQALERAELSLED